MDGRADKTPLTLLCNLDGFCVFFNYLIMCELILSAWINSLCELFGEACVFGIRSVIYHELILYDTLHCCGIILHTDLYIFTIFIPFDSSIIRWVFL